ncbi:CPBP family intramembrane metalloprotease [Vagococcus sp. BWB3-3]|uniref:CPBP family intramembrane metalloprotease n=1 Tax=Vagococcus allomyrinae TaxID=2794353 RepID=A0A940P416_9ENTE|nr:CPBP family intramembrane glutamic endopeptidase [Vagococcus allomyrinae]MBP1041047.1 CPBP family intramembrane metalloprotease [Vagococcus allomyrinae]
MERSKKIIGPILIVILYLVYFYFYLACVWQNGGIIKVKDVTAANLSVKLLGDFLGNLAMPLVLILGTWFQDKSLKKIGLTLTRPFLIGGLAILYLVMFIVNQDFSLTGFYQAFFYLVVVAFSEEVIFRGYLFSKIEEEYGFWIGAIISGMLFGAAHAFLPSIINEANLVTLFKGMLSEMIGQGILGGAIFAILYKKSGTLFVPILVHAIFDYLSVVFN